MSKTHDLKKEVPLGIIEKILDIKNFLIFVSAFLFLDIFLALAEKTNIFDYKFSMDGNIILKFIFFIFLYGCAMIICSIPGTYVNHKLLSNSTKHLDTSQYISYGDLLRHSIETQNEFLLNLCKDMQKQRCDNLLISRLASACIAIFLFSCIVGHIKSINTLCYISAFSTTQPSLIIFPGVLTIFFAKMSHHFFASGFDDYVFAPKLATIINEDKIKRINSMRTATVVSDLSR
jgi:hypothetical protein